MDLLNTTLNDNGAMEEKLLVRICAEIRQYNYNVMTRLEEIISQLCDVDVVEMMRDTKHLYNVQARWLYWYARRYMTNESYASISKGARWDRTFTVACISYAINNMSELINANTIWTKRWAIVKRIIKASLDTSNIDDTKKNDVTIRVISPKNIKVEHIKE